MNDDFRRLITTTTTTTPVPTTIASEEAEEEELIATYSTPRPQPRFVPPLISDSQLFSYLFSTKGRMVGINHNFTSIQVSNFRFTNSARVYTTTPRSTDYCALLNCNFDGALPSINQYIKQITSENACNYLNHGLTKVPWTLRNRGMYFIVIRES